MFPEQLKKILRSIKKTGDKVILYNENEPENAYVLMNFKDYESFSGEEITVKTEPDKPNDADLTADDLTDRINCDISAWKNQENGPYLAEESKSRNPWAIPVKVKNGAQKVE